MQVKGKYIFLLFIWFLHLTLMVGCINNTKKRTLPSPKTSPKNKTISREPIVKEIENTKAIPPNSIFEAVIKGDEKTTLKLIKNNPKLANAENIYNYARRPLHYAAIYGKDKIVKILIDHGAIPDELDRDYLRTPLHYAAMMGNLKCAKILLEEDIDIDEGDANGWTPLHLAASKGRREMIRLLIEKGANINAKDEMGRTPLHVAIMYDQPSSVRTLISLGASVNMKDSEGNSPLYIARLWKASDEIVKILKTHGAKETGPRHKEILSKSKTPNPTSTSTLTSSKTHSPLDALNNAILDKNVEKFENLLKNTNINTKFFDGVSLLHKAVMYKFIDGVKLLLKKGANVNVKDPSGFTPLHYTAIYGERDMDEREASDYDNIEIAKMLIKYGANINAKDNYGRTPLHYARSKVFADLLISSKANLNIQDNMGWTPLHMAAMKGESKVAEELLKAGANPNIKDKDGHTPLDVTSIPWLQREGGYKVRKVLEKYGKGS